MRNHYHSSSHTTVDVGETHVTLREQGGRVRVARILEKTTDGEGRVAFLLLDRIVHQRFGQLSGWKASGCFVTELVRDGGER